MNKYTVFGKRRRLASRGGDEPRMGPTDNFTLTTLKLSEKRRYENMTEKCDEAEKKSSGRYYAVW